MYQEKIKHHTAAPNGPPESAAPVCLLHPTMFCLQKSIKKRRAAIERFSNIVTSAGKANISCCGRQLAVLTSKEGDEAHERSIEEMDGEYYVTVSHEMRKSHYISFAAYVHDSGIWIQRLYPEQSPAFRMPMVQRDGTLCLYCVKHGLFQYPLVDRAR